MKQNSALKAVPEPRAATSESSQKPARKQRRRRKKGVCEVPNGPFLDVDAILRKSEPGYLLGRQ